MLNELLYPFVVDHGGRHDKSVWLMVPLSYLNCYGVCVGMGGEKATREGNYVGREERSGKILKGRLKGARGRKGKGMRKQGPV